MVGFGRPRVAVIMVEARWGDCQSQLILKPRGTCPCYMPPKRHCSSTACVCMHMSTHSAMRPSPQSTVQHIWILLLLFLLNRLPLLLPHLFNPL